MTAQTADLGNPNAADGPHGHTGAPYTYDGHGASQPGIGKPVGFPYPLYEAPQLDSFDNLLECMADFGDTQVAFERADGERVTYRALVNAVRRERLALDGLDLARASSADRFIVVCDSDPVTFTARYLAAVTSGRCAVLCPLKDWQRAALEAEGVPEGVCTIASSSGTSGRPKAAMLIEQGLLSDLISGLELYEFAPGARYAKLLPYTHAFGLVCDLLAPLATGGTIALPHTSTTFAAELPRLAPTALNLPPRAASLLADFLDKGLYRLPTLCKMLCGGAGLPASVTQRLRAHGIEAFGCYGLTECSPCVSVNRDGWHKDGSCGVPLRCNEVQVAPNCEILVRGPNVMAGYLGDTALTSERLHDGWLHTGDVGRIDADGFLYVDGRLDDVIVLSDGTKVAPEVIERALEAHPTITQALVYGADKSNRAGMSSRTSDQTVLACKIVLAEDASKSDEADAVEFARSIIAPEGAYIEHVTVTRSPLPTNAAGKLLRRLM